jgi:hypothetical protein
MIALIDLYEKELLKVNGFAPSTVETYLISVKAFCEYAAGELNKRIDRIKGPDLMQWLQIVKPDRHRPDPPGASSLCAEKLFCLS